MIFINLKLGLYFFLKCQQICAVVHVLFFFYGIILEVLLFMAKAFRNSFVISEDPNINLT